MKSWLPILIIIATLMLILVSAFSITHRQQGPIDFIPLVPVSETSVPLDNNIIRKFVSPYYFSFVDGLVSISRNDHFITVDIGNKDIHEVYSDPLVTKYECGDFKLITVRGCYYFFIIRKDEEPLNIKDNKNGLILDEGSIVKLSLPINNDEKKLLKNNYRMVTRSWISYKFKDTEVVITRNYDSDTLLLTSDSQIVKGNKWSTTHHLGVSYKIPDEDMYKSEIKKEFRNLLISLENNDRSKIDDLYKTIKIVNPPLDEKEKLYLSFIRSTIDLHRGRSIDKRDNQSVDWYDGTATLETILDQLLIVLEKKINNINNDKYEDAIVILSMIGKLNWNI